MKASDKKLAEYIKQLKIESETWCILVDNIGNQCASTDRQIEKILDIANELKIEYDKIGL